MTASVQAREEHGFYCCWSPGGYARWRPHPHTYTLVNMGNVERMYWLMVLCDIGGWPLLFLDLMKHRLVCRIWGDIEYDLGVTDREGAPVRLGYSSHIIDTAARTSICSRKAEYTPVSHLRRPNVSNTTVPTIKGQGWGRHELSIMLSNQFTWALFSRRNRLAFHCWLVLCFPGGHRQMN